MEPGRIELFPGFTHFGFCATLAWHRQARCAGINLAGAASRAHPGLALSETWAARVTDLSHVGVMGGCLSREQEYMYASTIQPAADEANSQLFAQ